MSQLLIDVRIEGYFLQLLINRQSNIKDLVKAMRENQFIKEDKQDHTLQFYNEKGERLILTDSITRAIIHQSGKSHKIQIKTIRDESKQVKQVKPSIISGRPFQKKHKSEQLFSSVYEASQIKKQKSDSLNQSVIQEKSEQMDEGNQGVSKFFQQKTNKILEKILHYLQKKNFKGLMKPNTNSKIDQKMKKSLYRIGEHFMALQKLKDGLDQALSKLCIGNQKSLKQLEKIKQQYSLPAQKCILIDELKQKINKFNAADEIVQISQIQEKSFEEQVNSLKKKIKQLQDQKKTNKTEIQKRTYQNESLSKQIKDYQLKVKNFEVKLKTKQQQNIQTLQKLNQDKKKLKDQLNSFKMHIQQLQLKNKQITNDLDFQKKKNNLRSENQNKIIEYQEQLKINSNKLKQTQNELKQKIIQTKKYQQKINIIEKELQQVIQKNQELQNQVKNLELTLKKITQQFKAISQNYQKLQKKKMEQEVVQVQQVAQNYQKIFNKTYSRQTFSKYLQKVHQFGVQDLIGAIQSQTRNQIQKVSKIIQYSDQNENKNRSIHEFIDDIPNLLFIARTTQKSFGAFSQNSFTLQRDQQIKKSFLFSQIQGNFIKWNLINGQEPLTYDSDFLIYGNQEIKIENNSLSCYSLLNNQNRLQSFLFSEQDKKYFKFLSNQSKVNQIQNKVKLQFFQFYKIQFKEKIYQEKKADKCKDNLPKIAKDQENIKEISKVKDKNKSKNKNVNSHEKRK